MDGVATVGVTTAFSREDHIHPSDTSKAAVVHNHTASQITDFAEATDDRVASLLVAGSNITLTYSDPANTLTVASTGGGGGGMAIGGAVTGGTNKSVLFIDSSGNLAQNNTHFSFDPATSYLKIGTTGTFGIYYVNNVPALYQVVTGGGVNWFEGNSGNLTLSGYGNFGTGDGVLVSLTSGSGNVGIGGTSIASPRATLNAMTSGSDNLAVGSSAMMNMVTGDRNVAIGNSAMLNSALNTDCVALGARAFNVLGQSFSTYSNVAVGTSAAAGIKTGDSNVFIGNGCGGLMTDGAQNTIIGAGTLSNAFSSCNFNTVIGSFLGASLAGVNDTVIISGGRDNPRPRLDCDYTQPFWYGVNGNAHIWSFNTAVSNGAIGLHLYRTEDACPGPVNFERAVLDWNVMSNVFVIGTEAGGTGTIRLTAINGFAKAGSPAASDLPANSFAVIDDTSAGQTWMVFNKAGTIRKVQLV